MINEDAKVSLDMKRAETILKFRKLNNFFLWVISVLFTTEQLCDFLKNSLKNLQRRNTGRGQIRKLKTPLQDGLVFPEIEREKLDKFFEVCDWNLVEAPLKTVDLSNLQDRSLGYFVQIIQNHEKEVRKRQRDVERHLNQICRFCEILENRQRLNLLSTEEINQLQEFRENEKTLRSIFQNIVKSVNEIDFVEDFSEGEVSEEDDSSMSVSEMSEEEDIQITEASDHPSSSCHNDITTVEQFKCFTNKDENESKLKEEEIGEVQPPTSAQTEMSGEEDVSMEEQKEPPSTSCNRDIASLEKEASGCKTMDYDMENENFEIESKERHCEATDLSTSSQEKITCTLEKMEICGPSLEDYLKNNFISQETIGVNEIEFVEDSSDAEVSDEYDCSISVSEIEHLRKYSKILGDLNCQIESLIYLIELLGYAKSGEQIQDYTENEAALAKLLDEIQYFNTPMLRCRDPQIRKSGARSADTNVKRRGAPMKPNKNDKEAKKRERDREAQRKSLLSKIIRKEKLQREISELDRKIWAEIAKAKRLKISIDIPWEFLDMNKSFQFTEGNRILALFKKGSTAVQRLIEHYKNAQYVEDKVAQDSSNQAAEGQQGVADDTCTPSEEDRRVWENPSLFVERATTSQVEVAQPCSSTAMPSDRSTARNNWSQNANQMRINWINYNPFTREGMTVGPYNAPHLHQQASGTEQTADITWNAKHGCSAEQFHDPGSYQHGATFGCYMSQGDTLYQHAPVYTDMELRSDFPGSSSNRSQQLPPQQLENRQIHFLEEFNKSLEDEQGPST